MILLANSRDASGIAVDAFLFPVYQLLGNCEKLHRIGNGISLRRKIPIKIMQKSKFNISLLNELIYFY